ncbi:hypothetical protein ISN44_Un78g000090 [Arabidopsis suecica]|uniref:Zinc finger GRF-type domain-containing protein n=1 Tax=Arabidopsis suecica TaxID=45249 RepID=A0A8T1XJD4_ARASU|nr:hypothetical protein ISN44_Un78g000090 [Arabidopsis suecica]
MFESSSFTSQQRRGPSMSQNGITRRCFCGGLAIIQTSRTATNPGRIFYTCVMSGDGGNHIWKLCDEVMMEEIVQLGLEMQDLNNLIHCIPDSRTGHVGGYDPRISQLSETIKMVMLVVMILGSLKIV